MKKPMYVYPIYNNRYVKSVLSLGGCADLQYSKTPCQWRRDRAEFAFAGIENVILKETAISVYNGVVITHLANGNFIGYKIERETIDEAKKDIYREWKGESPTGGIFDV